MGRPFVGISGQIFGFWFLLISILICLRSFRILFSRLNRIKQLFKRRGIKRFSNWLFMFGEFGVVSFSGVFFMIISFSLMPFGLICFHYVIFRVGVSISFWVVIFFCRKDRLRQFKKEYLQDASLRGFWAFVAVFVERIRRIARALTLGARLGVNIMIGRVLHTVISGRLTSLGILIFCAFEVLVVIIQTYVFILLLLSYRRELR